MAFTPQNFVDQVGPDVSAEWLNGVDETVNNALQGVQTTAQLSTLISSLPGQILAVLTASMPSIVVQADSSGNVTDFSTAAGQATLMQGQTNVTSQAVFSISAINCAATITAAGQYQFTSFLATTPNGLATIKAVYLGVTYIVQVSISKALAGTVGPAGPAGAGGILLVLSNPQATVLTYASGTVPSFAGLNGVARVLNGGVDVSASATFSATGSGLIGTVNTAANTPVAGQPLGYYQVTAMSAPIAELTISAVYMGNTLTAIYTVSQVPTGYQIVTSLPTVGSPQDFEGNIVYLTTDGQLYRYHSGVWTVAVPAVNITGQITTTQITPGSITTPLLAANSVTAAQIAANTIVAGNLAAGSVTTNALSAGAVTAAKIGVTQLSAITANMGTITAGLVQNAGGSVYFDFNNGWLVFNSGVNMYVQGNGFGAAANYIAWFGPTQSSATNWAACTDALAIYYLKTDGTYKFGAALQAPATTVYSGTGSNINITVPTGKTTMTVELWSDTGGGAASSNPGTVRGAGGGGPSYCKSIYTLTAADWGTTIVFNGFTGSSGGMLSTVTAGSFPGFTTMSAPGGMSGTGSGAGVGGAGGLTPTGGTNINVAGVDGSAGSSDGSLTMGKGGAAASGTYAAGNNGAGGSVNASAHGGLPAICGVTFN